MGEVVLSCLGDGTIDDRGNPEGVEGTGDDPEMADRDVGSFDEVSRLMSTTQHDCSGPPEHTKTVQANMVIVIVKESSRARYYASTKVPRPILQQRIMNYTKGCHMQFQMLL